MGKLDQQQLEGLFAGVEYAGRHDYAGITYVWTESWLADARSVEMCWSDSMKTFEIEPEEFGSTLRSSAAAERYPIAIDEDIYWIGTPDEPIFIRRLGNFQTVNLWVRASWYEALSRAFDNADDLVLDPWRNQLAWLYHDRLFPAALLKAVELDTVPQMVADL